MLPYLTWLHDMMDSMSHGVVDTGTYGMKNHVRWMLAGAGLSEDRKSVYWFEMAWEDCVYSMMMMGMMYLLSCIDRALLPIEKSIDVDRVGGSILVWYAQGGTAAQPRTTLQFTDIFGRVKMGEEISRYAGIFSRCTEPESKFQRIHLWCPMILKCIKCLGVEFTHSTDYPGLLVWQGIISNRTFISDANEGFNGSDAWRGKEGE